MVIALQDHGIAASIDPATTSPNWYSYINSTKLPYASPNYSNNPTLHTSDVEIVGAVTNLTGVAIHTPTFNGSIGLQSNASGDYHERVWVIPGLLNLSNPTLGANVPFYMWNTFSTPQTLNQLNVNGSSVLSFDISVGNVLRDLQYREVNLQLAAGEPTIDADVQFVFDDGIGTLSVLAVVAETFPILPEVPVNETWMWETDVLTTYNGEQTRLALMPNPRVNLDFNVRVVDYGERRTLYGLTSGNIKVQSLIPMFQYASQITQTSGIGTSRIYFDPKLCNARVDGTVVVINRLTQQIVLGKVSEVHTDGVTLNVALGEEISNPLWFAVPAVSCHLNDASGLSFGTQAGTFSLTAEALDDIELERPDSVQTITQYDSMPVVEKNFLIPATEKWAYRRELMDGGVGRRAIKASDDHFVINRSVKFAVSRTDDEMDYWRALFASVNGGQKPFLLSTQLPDLTLREDHEDAAGVLEINENDYVSKLYALDTFRRIKVSYTDGTWSHHNVTVATTNDLEESQIGISPALDEGKTVFRLSYLHKVRSSDKVTLEHFNDYSYIKFSVRTLNN